jgi:hypothetical protein
MHDQTVCRMHGGQAPQNLRKAAERADERMRALVHPAISSLARQVTADEFQAVRYVLDWAGFKAVEHVQTESDQQVTITVRYQDVEQPAAHRARSREQILEHTHGLPSSSSNGHD